MERFFAGAAKRLGYRLRRIDDEQGDVRHYFFTLRGALAVHGSLSFVQIGANDGAIGDPLYEFVKANAASTQIVLVEPQKFLIPILSENYAYHPNKFIFNGAVGEKGELSLYGVNPDFWPQLNVPYARRKNWPSYRAPTGITSSRREHVRSWLAKYLPKSVKPEDAIQKFDVPCLPLAEVLQSLQRPLKIDVLQVDVEGADDEVIYCCDLERTAPGIIHFEAEHLSQERLGRLRAYLGSNGYVVYSLGSNSLAIRRNPKEPVGTRDG
jgi:FkbM family methyltransferase